MKICIFICLTFIPATVAAQTVPAKIVSILDDKHKGWTLIGNKCGQSKSVFTADLNADGRDDYVIQFISTNEKGNKVITLDAFYSSQSEFLRQELFEESYDGRGQKLAFEILPTGTDLKLGPPYDLKSGGARVYVCGSDDFYIWRVENGRLGGGYNRYYVIN